jgi:hypothetical protein
MVSEGEATEVTTVVEIATEVTPEFDVIANFKAAR